MGHAGLQFVSENRGATEQAMSVISMVQNEAIYNKLISNPVKSDP
jgi:hypothetical protein